MESGGAAFVDQVKLCTNVDQQPNKVFPSSTLKSPTLQVSMVIITAILIVLMSMSLHAKVIGQKLRGSFCEQPILPD